MSMVDVNQDTAETHIILGNLFRNRGEVDRAIRIHQNLIARPELDPEVRKECSIELAKDYLKAGFLDRAESIFSKISKEVGSSTQVFLYLKEIYESEKEWEKAINVTTQIQSASNDDYSDIISHYFCELAELELSLPDKNSKEKAKKYINKALNYNKNSPRALILQGDLSYENNNFVDALKKYMYIYENYSQYSYLVLEKLKNTHEKLNTKESFYSFIKNISSLGNQMELYSSLTKEYSSSISNNEISNLYEEEFKNNKVTLEQLSEYLDLINQNKIAFDNNSLKNIKKCIDLFTQKEITHKCNNCGFSSIKHYWQCPSCHQWSSIKKQYMNKSKTDHYVV
tara:strand:+ start:8 stop:1030 length:1023 start_codon:yes stop_codon:yes gene_type:complete